MGRWGNGEGKLSVDEKRSGENMRSEEKRSGKGKHFMKEERSGKERRSMKEEPEECKDFEKLIPDFITKEMDYPTLKRFYEHVQHCPDCREELDIQFLVQEGMQRLEEGNAFDLQSELKQRMEEAAKSIRYHGAFLYLGIVMEIVAVGLLIGIVIWILL